MLSLWKKLLMTGGSVAVLAALGAASLGWDSVATWATAARNRARTAFEEGKSDVQKAAEAEVRLGRMQEERTRIGRKLAEHEITLEDYERKTDRLEADLAQQENCLQRARKFLDSDKDRLSIGGRSWTREEVSEDAAARLERCKSLRTQLSQTRVQRTQLASLLEKGKQDVAKAQEKETELRTRLEGLKGRLDHAQLRQRTAELLGVLDASPGEQTTKLMDSLDAVERGVRKLERQLDQDAVRVPAGLIDWSGKKASTRDTAANIDAYFDGRVDGGIASQEG